MQELLPCPFCGSSDIHESGDNGYGSFWVVCEGCGVNTSEVGVANQAEANARWNTRVFTAQQTRAPYRVENVSSEKPASAEKPDAP